MKRKYKLVVIVAFCVLIIMCCIRFFSKGHTITYKVGKDKYEVREVYTRKAKNEIDNYYLEITVEDIPYAFQFYHTFSKKRKVVEDILSYQGDYQCVLPIIEGKAITDLLCYQGNRYYFYHDLIGKDKDLDQFVKDIDIHLYDKDDWLDQSTEAKSSYNITLYTRNVVENHNVILSNLKGIYQINDKIENIPVLEKDVYQKKLSTLTSRYYVVADYNTTQQFRIFYIVDVETGKISEAKAPAYLSFDSYIQGVVDDKVYIYDKDNEKQYRLNPKKKKIEEIGNEKKKIQYYQNGEWEEISTTKANSELYFDMTVNDIDFSQFDEVYHVGGKNSGYYYLLQKSKSGYEVYRAPSQNKKVITYITTIGNKEDFFLLDDYIYWKDGNQIKYYQDEQGICTLLEYNELEFNDYILFGVTKK